MFTLSTKISQDAVAPLERPYHRGNLRQALIETGLEVIAERGVRALTLREIGTRLKVSRMAPYRHFADKAALLAAITVTGFERFTEVLEAAVHSAPGDFVAQADALSVAYVRFARENQAHFEVMFGGGGEPQYLDESGKQIAYRSFEVLQTLVEAGQAQGLIIAGNPSVIAQMIWATVHGISLLKVGTESPEGVWSPDFTLYCAKILRSGLQPR